MKRALLILALAAATAFGAVRATAKEIGFAEKYVLAKDKDEAIKNLIPGTDEHYYYQCLHLQAAGQYEQV